MRRGAGWPAKPVVVTGLVAIAVYLASAVLSGSLSPLARRPLLDGVHQAPPYNWVAPPPELAAQNQPPQGATESAPLTAAGSGQLIVNTPDQQVSLLLQDGAIPPAATPAKAEVVVEPLDPKPYGEPPDGLAIRGNVYRIAMRYAPGGAPVPSLAKPATLTLTYPAPTPELLGVKHRLVHSADGKRWKYVVGASDQHATQQIWAQVRSIGYYAVVAPSAASTEGGFPFTIAVVAVAAVAAGAGIWLQVSARRAEAARRAQRHREALRRSRSTKRR